MELEYIQRKSAVSSILWILGCGLGMTYYPVKKVYAGFDLGPTIWLCRQSEGFCCGDQTTQLDKLVDNFQAYIIKHPKHAAYIKKVYLGRAAKFSDFINGCLAKRDYTKASNKTLWTDYKRAERGYQEVYPYGEPLAIAIGNLSDRIKEQFLKKGLSNTQFEKLLLPTEISFIQKEQEEFFKLALDNRGRTISALTLRKLRAHYNRYTWLPYDYGVTAYSFDYFNNQLAALLKKDQALVKQKYLDLKNYSQNLSKEQALIIKKFKINHREQSLIEIIKIAFYLVDAKKELFTRGHWFAERLFSAISSRLDIPPHLLKYALPDEVRGFLAGKKPNLKKLQSRYDNCVLRIGPTGSLKIIDGPAAKRIIDNFIAARNRPAETIDLKGRIANPGISRGFARVILDARECNIFKHGEILVTAMTSPDYMVAARRAAAIVTDEGGITCHAAIIARELKIPCIIGLKIATKVLRTGDLIEVDADKGLIRLLEK